VNFEKLYSLYSAYGKHLSRKKLHMAKIIYDKDIFSTNIKELLSENKLNRSGLAKCAKVTPSTIGRYIRKEVIADQKNIDEIANVFKVNVLWLLLGEGPKYATEEETNSVEHSGCRKKGPLDECFEMLRQIQALDRKVFFTIKASLEGVLNAWKFKGQKDVKIPVDRRHGERRTKTQGVESERRRTDRRRLEEVSV